MPVPKHLKVAVETLLGKEGPQTFNDICRRISGSRKLIYDTLDELRGLKRVCFDESFQTDHFPGKWKLVSHPREAQEKKKGNAPDPMRPIGTGRTEFEKYL